MKKIVLLLVVLASLKTSAQNVGIGTTQPKARLHVADSAVLFSGPVNIPANATFPALPISGEGVRLMWLAPKAAFRAGYASSAEWDQNNIGRYSTATGLNTVASGWGSVALGYGTNALGTATTGLGYFSNAKNDFSTAIGYGAATAADYSISIGSYTKSKSPYGFVAGVMNDTSSTTSVFEVGNGNVGNGVRKNALTILSNGSVGIGTIAPAALLHVNNGAVLFSGLAINNPPAPAVEGAGTRMMWYPEKAALRAGTVTGTHWDQDSIGYYSFAAGLNTKAIGFGSVALGYRSIAAADYGIAVGDSAVAIYNSSVSMGSHTVSRAFGSVAMGQGTSALLAGSTAFGNWTSASGESSFAAGRYSTAESYSTFAVGEKNRAVAAFSSSMGIQSQAFGEVSFVTGEVNYARARGSFTTGTFNDSLDTPDNASAASTDRVFQIGNGSANNNRRNAFTMLRNGYIGLNNNNSPVAPFSFSNDAGDKISLYGTSATAQYGFGIQGGLLQMYTDAVNANIAFGYGASASFIERARIINNGADAMFMNGRISLKNGTADINNGPGVWLYTPNNSGQLAFMGTQNSSNVGFYGGPALWGFTYNVPTGRIGINNNTPNAQLAFGATLEKKITLYPGGTGDVGLSVAGNDMRLYADNAAARVSFGFDNYASGFTSRAYVPASGSVAMVVQGQLNANGTIYNSDVRYKKNIHTLEGSLEKIMQLRGVEYEMRTKDFPAMQFSDGAQVGLIAQEVEKLVPQVVSTNADGYKSVDYAKLVPVLIEGMKAQQQEIELLKKQVASLMK